MAQSTGGRQHWDAPVGTLGTVGDQPQNRAALLLARQNAINAEAERLRVRRDAEYRRAEMQRDRQRRESRQDKTERRETKLAGRES